MWFPFDELVESKYLVVYDSSLQFQTILSCTVVESRRSEVTFCFCIECACDNNVLTMKLTRICLSYSS